MIATSALLSLTAQQYHWVLRTQCS